jgi:general secretion pathway protein G
MSPLKKRPSGLRSEGFTLIELLVVLVILGLLAGIVAPNVIRYLGRAKTDTARVQIKQLDHALEQFYLDNGRYPSNEESLNALVTPPGQASNWHGPYVKSVPKDPWGHPYVYRVPGQNSHGPYDLYSLGRDGQEGGSGEDADIGNWETQ